MPAAIDDLGANLRPTDATALRAQRRSEFTKLAQPASASQPKPQALPRRAAYLALPSTPTR